MFREYNLILVRSLVEILALSTGHFSCNFFSHALSPLNYAPTTTNCRLGSYDTLVGFNFWPQQANETGMQKAAEPTMTALFRQKRQQENDPFSQFFLHNAHTIPMAFVPASAKRNGVFGLVTCRLDSYTALVGFNFRPKQKEWALLYLFREWSPSSKVWHSFIRKDRPSVMRYACLPTSSTCPKLQQTNEFDRHTHSHWVCKASSVIKQQPSLC